MNMDGATGGPSDDEINFGEETDGLRQKSCEKNPGHKKFIPVGKFDVKHLPTGYRGSDMWKAIKTLSNLTVHVSVSCVSENRPKTYLGTDIPYPRSGKSLGNTLGTGQVCDLLKHTKVLLTEPKTKLCQCNKCLNQKMSQRKIRFAEVFISTAGHVVFDDLEGKETTCYLYFDSGNTPNTCGDVVELSGMFKVLNETETDLCKMIYFTHNKDVIETLENKLTELRDLERTIKEKYDFRVLTENQLTRTHQVPVVIVSHPHGCNKQVSVGDCVHLDNDKSIIEYTTATCPGSSGAPVFFMSKLGNDRPTHVSGEKECNYGKFSGDKAS